MQRRTATVPLMAAMAMGLTAGAGTAAAQTTADLAMTRTNLANSRHARKPPGRQGSCHRERG
jgi:hypothetical protein